MRIITHFSKEPNLILGFQKNEDLFITALLDWFPGTNEKDKPEVRKKVKMIFYAGKSFLLK